MFICFAGSSFPCGQTISALFKVNGGRAGVSDSIVGEQTPDEEFEGLGPWEFEEVPDESNPGVEIGCCSGDCESTSVLSHVGDG